MRHGAEGNLKPNPVTYRYHGEFSELGMLLALRNRVLSVLRRELGDLS